MISSADEIENRIESVRDQLAEKANQTADYRDYIDTEIRKLSRIIQNRFCRIFGNKDKSKQQVARLACLEKQIGPLKQTANYAEELLARTRATEEWVYHQIWNEEANLTEIPKQVEHTLVALEKDVNDFVNGQAKLKTVSLRYAALRTFDNSIHGTTAVVG